MIFSGVDEAVQLWQAVVDGTPNGHPSKPGRVSALATAQFLRFRRDPADLASLDTAIGNLRDALGLVPANHALRLMLLTNLGALLLSRFEYTGEQDSLDEAILLSRQAAVSAPAGHSNRGQYLSNLGIALVHQARLSDAEDDAKQAITALPSVSGSGETPGTTVTGGT